ncbi:MAG: D-alanyl-D-alanine carboxypeptidase family protein [Blastococcus sp.]|nr:D-alanyl-D-alanine carboxypeptidase family protein [Blastococcus sp.]
MSPRSPWRSPQPRAIRRPAPLLLVPLALLALTSTAAPASAAPSDQPGGTSGVLDSRALDELQQRAAEVQRGLRSQQGEVESARAALGEAERALADAEAVLGDAEGALAGHRQLVARYASAVYRDGGAITPLSVLLSGGDPGDVVSALGFLEVVDRHAATVIGEAEAQRQAAGEQQQRATEALGQARARADEVGARAAELEAEASAVTEELDAALGAVDRQLAQLQREQVEVNGRTAASWRTYLDQLTAAGVVPPPSAVLRDPVAGLPERLVPVGAAGGGAQQGAAQLPGRPASLLVLPAETLAAVTAAMDALGLPYAPGTAGPESWDCGSLVQSVYGRAGIQLPGEQAELFAVTAPVAPADVLPGDLVFLGTQESGLGHVGIALDPRTMLAADARAGAVVVRTLPADQVLGVGRPSLGQRAPVPAPGPAAGALRTECGNTVYPPSYDGARQWGGYPNGLIPPSAMCPLGPAGHSLRCDAAAAYRAMAAAYAAAFGGPLCITDSYRTYAGQVKLYGEKPALAAVPGTSNHGWGLAVDLCGGVETFGTPQYAWMVANAGRFGFLHPTWADPGNGREEPWHWEYAGT